MTRLSWIILFLVLLGADLAVIMTGNESWRYFTKASLMPVLAIYFFLYVHSFPSSFKKWIIMALVFSWAGDILLQLEDKGSIFFLLGLSSFLLAHCCYIAFFLSIRIREGIKSRPLLLLPVILYYVFLIRLLSPYLHEMNIPVRVYGIVISFMLLLALHLPYSSRRMAAWLMVAGAISFLLSDSLLAVNKFYEAFPLAGIFIMATYGLAQLFITQGAINYIRNSEKEARN